MANSGEQEWGRDTRLGTRLLFRGFGEEQQQCILLFAVNERRAGVSVVGIKKKKKRRKKRERLQRGYSSGAGVDTVNTVVLQYKVLDICRL